MSASLARYLKDFGAPAPRSLADEATASLGMEAAPPVDVEAERADAHAEGYAAAQADLGVRHAAEIAGREAAHAAEIAALRARYETDYAAALADRFSTMAAEAAERMSAAVAPVLAPLLDEALTARAVADLAAMVADGLQAGEGLSVTVSGPERLFRALAAHFPGEVPVFRHVEADDVDLTVEFADTVLVTRMAAWADTLRKVLA